MNSSTKLIEYNESLAPSFYEINAEWISSMFEIEPTDLDTLKKPEKIISSGGRIWFIESEKLGIIGTCALVKDNEGNFELSKMGVLKKARGLKAGEKLLKHVVEFVKTNKLSCYLLTNKKCEAAIHLYKKVGFQHDPSTLNNKGGRYERCDVGMVLKY